MTENGNIVVPYLKGLKITLTVLSSIVLTLLIIYLGLVINMVIMDQDENGIYLAVAIPVLVISIAFSVITLIAIIKEIIILIRLALILGLIGMVRSLFAPDILGFITGIIGNLLYYWYYTLIVTKQELMDQFKYGRQMNI